MKTMLSRISTRLNSRLSCAVMLVLVLAAVPAYAQLPTGTILGEVRDATGGTVAGAKVTVTNIDTGAMRTQETGDVGTYRFPALPVGDYMVQIVKDGFQTFDRKGLTLLVGQEIPVEVTLQVGSTGQTVTVTEQAPQVNTTNATTGGIVDEQQVADLPLNGRNLVDLTLLQAGVTQSNVFNMLGNVVGATNIVGTTFAANGAAIHSNNFLLDGAIQTGQLSMNNASIIGTTLGLDGVKEYKVVSSLPPAEYGMVMGATSTTVSKGGTNQWHGDAFDYLRNSAMDARNYFDALDTVNFNGAGTDKSATFPGKRLPPFQRNNYGGAFGGPIKKDKTFFWAVYEGLSQNLGPTIQTTTLPGPCYDQTVGSPTFHQVTPASFANANCSNVPVAQQNPLTMQYVDSTIFANQPGVGFFPYPNTNVDALGNRLPNTAFNYSFPYIQPSHENYGQMRVDHNFSASDSFFARFTQDDANQIAAQTGYPQVHNVQSSAYTFITFSENHIFSPTVLNTLRYSLQRTVTIANISSNPNIPDKYLLSPHASDGEGFQVFNSIGPGSAPNNIAVGAGVAVSSYSASTGGDGTYKQNIYSYSDDLYWTKGRNAFKFGAVYNSFQLSQNQVFQQGGSASFANFAAFAKGVWGTMTTTGGTQFPLEQRYYLFGDYGFYAQDDLRATSKLTLNLGLRYEFSTTPREYGGLDYTIPSIAAAPGQNSTLGAVPGRMFGHNPFLHNFGPRIGFAYDPFGKGTTSIRGGAGLYYDVAGYGGAMLYEDCCQPPTSFTISVTNTNPTISSSPNNPDPTQNLFPFSVPLATAPSAQGGGSYYGGPNVLNGAALPSPRNVDYNIKAPSMIQYNLGVDRQLPWNIGLSVSYVGSRGYHLPTDVEGNLSQPLGFLPNGLPYYCYNASISQGANGLGNPADPNNDPTCANSKLTVAGTGPGFATSCTIAGAQQSATNQPCPKNAAEYLKRLNPTLGSIVQYTNRTQSWYNSLQVNVNKRVTKGLSFSEALTWSKLLDQGQAQQPAESNSLRQQDLLDPNQDRGRSGYNAAFNSRLNIIYHAPNINSTRLYAKALNGWWWSSILSIQSGYPFQPTIGARDFSGDSQDTSRPNLGSSFDGSKVTVGKPTQWFDPTMFAIPVVGTYGNATRNLLTAPGLRNLDFSMVKDTNVKWLGESGNIEFRAEFFNILNHPNFGLPNAVIWSSSAGTVTAFNGLYNPQIQPAGTIDPATGKTSVMAAPSTAGSISTTNNRSRQIQLALKVAF
jgi:hypothetical protein